jgi:hypothetical protein
MAMGTLHYMAPEALMLGSAVDHRADIYAVGVMLYQMLTGKLPQGMFELPSLQVPGLDPRYDGIISKAMREDREPALSSVLDLRRDLDAILTQPVVKVERATSTVLALGKFSLKDCIVRARFSGEWKIAPYLVMHHRGKGRFVSGILGTGNTFLRKVYLNPNGTTTYTDFSKKPAFPLTSGTSFEVELKVVGDRYTLSSGGRIIVEGTDDFYEEGGMGFRMEKDTVIEMLEVMPLENAEAPPAAPVANSDGWRSLLDEKGKLLAAFNANQADSDGWRTLQKGFMPLLEAKNAALRLKARGTQGAIVLIVGWNAEGVSSMHGFRAHVGVDRDHSRLYKGWINGVTIVNGVYKPAAYIPQAQPPLEEIPARGEYELELRLHESTLDILVNGRLVSQEKDLKLPGDWLALDTAGPAQFKSLEWRPLDAQGNPLSSAPPTAAKPQAEQQRLAAQYEAAIAQQVTPAVIAYAQASSSVTKPHLTAPR